MDTVLCTVEDGIQIVTPTGIREKRTQRGYIVKVDCRGGAAKIIDVRPGDEVAQTGEDIRVGNQVGQALFGLFEGSVVEKLKAELLIL